MSELFIIIMVICSMIALGSVAYRIGIDNGKANKVCEPGTVKSIIEHNRVICEFENDRLEIRKF